MITHTIDRFNDTLKSHQQDVVFHQRYPKQTNDVVMSQPLNLGHHLQEL